jgi:tetratricopeptide (TPR) repeat protein
VQPAAVAVAEGSPEGTSPAQSVSAPETRPVEARAEPPVSRAPELLARSRSVARSYGPRAGAEALAAGLRELPPGAPERADIYGELGNLHFAAGNFTAALAAYDSALRVLPDEERATMVRRLGPTYDRYHPSGRSHLEQFR